MLDSSFSYRPASHTVVFLAASIERQRTSFHHCISKVSHSAGNIVVISECVRISDLMNPRMHAGRNGCADPPPGLLSDGNRKKELRELEGL